MKIKTPTINCLLCILGSFVLSGCYGSISVGQPRISVNSHSGATIASFGQNQTPQPLKLASGKTVTVLGTQTIKFSKSGEPPALHLTYITNISLLNKPALRKEANEVWEIFRKQVEKVGNSTAMIMAQEKTVSGPLNRSKTFTFGWKRKSNGDWYAIN